MLKLYSITTNPQDLKKHQARDHTKYKCRHNTDQIKNLDKSKETEPDKEKCSVERHLQGHIHSRSMS